MDANIIIALVTAFIIITATSYWLFIRKTPQLPPSTETSPEELTDKSVIIKEHIPKTSEALKLTISPSTKALPNTIEPPEGKPEAVSWHARLTQGLQRTRSQLVRSLDEFLLSRDEKSEREALFEKIFEVLISADVGVKTTEYLVDRVKENLKSSDLGQAKIVKQALRHEILAILKGHAVTSFGTIEHPEAKPHVVLMVGVNGVGKTTTTGKLAFKASQKGLLVSVGAADTFRAAAVEQLKIWAERAHAEFTQLKEGADPASVAFEAVRCAKVQNRDLCIVDTAGRLHNRQDLMQELAKIRRVMSKEDSKSPHEVLLVLDATTGQNALQQAKIFREVIEITGLVLTKLDGTAKGGMALAIAHELKVPIRYIGVGETVEDLETFVAEEFVNALFEEA